jgi:hypothetical protein
MLNMSDKPIVFFIRNKPQGADIIDLNLKLKRVFVGYPPFKKGKKFDEKNIHSCTFDISKKFDKIDIETHDIVNPDNYKRGVTQNINLVNDAIPGSFVIIPRPEKGCYYVGKILRFELVDNPSWIEDYKRIRSEQGWDDWETRDVGYKYHVGDIIQSWVVEKFQEVPPSMFPSWIRHSLFGRSTLGRINDENNPLQSNDSVYDIISKLYNGEGIVIKSHSVKDKLLNYLSPETFEHFICNLLLLEYKNENQVWIHIGGSGDGGIDCMGFDKKSGETVGVAQCKLKKQSVKELKVLWNDLKKKSHGKVFICNFYCTEHIEEEEDLEILNQERILKLFEKHKDSNYWDIIK